LQNLQASNQFGDTKRARQDSSNVCLIEQC